MSNKIALQPTVAEPPGLRRLVPNIDDYPESEQAESLFEQVAWLYVFCRENLFRDDTARMSAALWPNEPPPAGTQMIELGCGPGFYSCRFAERYPQLSVVGVDRSERQLAWAEKRVEKRGLKNCRFERVNVLDIPYADAHFDVLIASRLFTVLPERAQAITEMFRVLRPGGRALVAEPRHAFRASVPLVAMWMLALVTHFHNGYREPHKAAILDGAEFRQLFAAQPWRHFRCWADGRYQYALCEKA